MNTRINLPVIFAAAVLGASSCAVSSHVAKDAQTLQISGAGVRQMPVVAELAVSDTCATADTCYKSYFWNTREAVMKRNVASSLLAASGADVLVHPKTDVEKENLRFPYVSTKVKVSGYPARYKNFRSATAEDFEVLDKADGKEVEEQSEGGIVINIGSYYAPADRVLNQGQTSALGLIGSMASKSTTQKSAAPKVKSKYRKTGFSWGFEGGLTATSNIAHVGDFSDPGGFGALYFGSQINPYVYLGGLIGCDGFPGDHKVNVPLAADLRVYTSKKKTAFFTDFRLGLLVLTNDPVADGLFETGIGGAFGCFELFLRYHLSFGEKRLQAEHWPYDYEGGFHLGQGFKLGIGFKF